MSIRSVFVFSFSSLLFLSACGLFVWLYFLYPNSQTANNNREIVRLLIDPTGKISELGSVAATKIPEFILDITEGKYKLLREASAGDVGKFVEAKLIPMARAEDTLEAEVSVDQEKGKLLINMKDQKNFTPGRYMLSLKLRTLEGDVNIEQDFTWGVIAVNTNKSIYEPGDAALIGMGVLNDGGETHCFSGEKSAKVWLTITDPTGEIKEYSTEDNSIKDSGKCSAVSVTNDADFQALFLVSKVGIHKMKVRAEIFGVSREIEDYFKVEEHPSFEIERFSFPTRIYPAADYPVTFKVTAKEDYRGVIEDIVPKDFLISKIGEGGSETVLGEFKRISWTVDLKKGKTQSFSYTIHFPYVSPEFYLIGPIKVGNFSEARQWQIASDAINSTSGVASWEDNGGPNTYSRVWTGTTWNPPLGSTATTLDTSPADGRWFKEVSSPKTGEKLVAVGDNVNPDDIYMFTWSGAAWSESFKIDLAVNGWDTTRGFDVAYEELSGDALFVYSNGSSNQLLYRRKSAGGSWDGASSNAGTAYSTFKKWVRLESQFQSDTILVGYLNDSELIGAMLWDGATNSFGNQFADNAGTATATSDEQAFDIAWETQSGTPMIFWGSTGNNIIYREFTGGTWQAEATGPTGFTNDSDWVLAAADPVSSSNNISIAIQDSTSCVLRFSVWTGAAFSTSGTTINCPSVTKNNYIDTAFENNSSKAMWTYVNNTDTDQISWLTWTSGGGFVGSTTETGDTTTIESVQLFSDLNTTSMMLLYHDNSGTSSRCQLWHREWDGTSWSAKNANPLYNNMCASADDDTVPFGFGFDRNLETFGAYRWFNNANSANVGTSLTVQDTPFTLTSANADFRLRVIVYYPDSLIISGRQYKLQFVDPGTGTCASPTGGTPSSWTDVGTGASTSIAFLDNASPADGVALTNNASDPVYGSYVVRNQTYEESNNFTNSQAAMAGDEVAKWDFALHDNTTYDRVPQTFCFRIVRSNGLVLQGTKYPQITTAAVQDVLIQGGSLIRGGTGINR